MDAALRVGPLGGWVQSSISLLEAPKPETSSLLGQPGITVTRKTHSYQTQSTGSKERE